MLQSSFPNISHGSKWHRIHTYHWLDWHLPSAFIPNSHPYCHSPLKTLPWQLHLASTRSRRQQKALNVLWNPSDSICSLWRKKLSWYLGTCILPASCTVHGLSSHHSAANFLENQKFGNICFTEKSKDSKHIRKTFWKKTNSSGEQQGDWQLVLLGKTANEVFADVRVKRNHVIQHYHIFHFRTISYRRFIYRNAKSHCSLNWWVTCHRLILKLKEKERFLRNMSLHITTKTTITYLNVSKLLTALLES